MMEKVYIKKIDRYEKKYIKLLKEVGLNNIMVPGLVVGSLCFMKKCNTIQPNNRADIRKVSNCLQRLYEYSLPVFSSGVYACFGINNSTNGYSYYEYLTNNVEEILSGTNKRIFQSPVFQLAYNMYSDNISELKSIRTTSFQLLHGDLTSGNIVIFNEHVRLIDWEYLQIGRKEVEIAFYLIWDYLGNVDAYDDFKRMKEEISVFMLRGILNEEQRYIVIRHLIPMFFVLCLSYTASGKLLHSMSRTKACELVIPEYYKNMYKKW